jgi:hypothetical protein
VAAPLFGAIGTAVTYATRTNTLVPVPAGTAANDVVVVYIYQDNATLQVITPPAGFTEIVFNPQLQTTGPQRFQIWWKRLTAADTGTYTFSHGSSHTEAVAVRYTGAVTTGTPYELLQFGIQNITSTTLPSLSGTTSGPDRLLIYAATSYQTVDFTPPTGFTERLDTDDLTVTDKPQATAGDTGAVVGTVSTASRTTAALLALIPGALPPVNYTSPQADTAGATDSVSDGLGKAVADTAAATDAAAGLLSKSASDVAAGTDSANDAMVRAPADILGLFETVDAAIVRPDIQDYQFVIPDAGWMPFGYGQTIVVENFDPGTAETRDQDKLSPVADIRWFGQDRRTPPTWSFDLYTDVQDAGQALLWASLFEQVWDREQTRSTPNAVLALRYKIAGRLRRVYGRPRNFTLIPAYVRTGRVNITCDFALAENTFYDDVQQTIRARIVATAIRQGFTFPLTFPLSALSPPTPRTEQITVGGTRPTWVDITIIGPVTDPYVDIGGQRWALRGDVLAGQSVRLSGAPWQQGLYRSDGTWVPGMLDPRARLSQLRLNPGTYSVQFGGYSGSASASADVTWRDAYGTM